VTDDQFRDLVLVLIFIVLIIAIVVGLYLSLYRYWKVRGLERFDHYLDSLEARRDQYRFFTTGHPQVWCETTEEEIKRKIANQCRHKPGIHELVPAPSNYLVRVNEDLGAVYVVFGDGRNFTFDWDSLVHYEN
jgi:hypothetical protein